MGAKFRSGSLMRIPFQRQPWMLYAKCRGEDPTLFVPPTNGRHRPAMVYLAKAHNICKTCPAKKACLEYGIKVNAEGSIWGDHWFPHYHRKGRTPKLLSTLLINPQSPSKPKRERLPKPKTIRTAISIHPEDRNYGGREWKY